MKLSSPASSVDSAIDVYEQEASLFFKDVSSTVIPDDVIQRRVPLSNVILTGHQAFFTREALRTILDTTLASISDFAAGRPARERNPPLAPWLWVQLTEIHRHAPRPRTSNQADDALYLLPRAIHLRAPALSDLTPIAEVFAIVPQKAVTTLPQSRPRPAHYLRTVC